LDEYDLQNDVTDISDVGYTAFISCLNDFFNKINYARTRFKLRKGQIDTGQAGTPIVIKPQFRAEIHGHLDTIRKIINANVYR
jgi:hypothetical protein